MKEFKNRYFMVVFLLSIAAFSVIMYQHASKDIFPSVDLSKIPAQIGTWGSRDIPLEKKIFDILQTPSVLVREYTDSRGKSVFLTIVYYRKNRVEFHSPERCAVSQGSYIDENGIEIIRDDARSIIANKFIVKGEGRKEVNLYYFKSGDFITSSYLKLKLHMMRNKLKGLPNSGALVKFSALVGQNINVDETIKVMKDFIKEVTPLLVSYLT